MRPIDADAMIQDLRRQFEAIYKSAIETPIMPDDPFVELLAKCEGLHMKAYIDNLCEYIDSRPTLEVQPVRRGGCEYCNGSGRVLYQETHSVKLYLNSFGDARTIEVEANRCPPFADCAMVNVPARSAFIINFCPNCGADMRQEEHHE